MSHVCIRRHFPKFNIFMWMVFCIDVFDVTTFRVLRYGTWCVRYAIVDHELVKWFSNIHELLHCGKTLINAMDIFNSLMRLFFQEVLCIVWFCCLMISNEYTVCRIRVLYTRRCGWDMQFSCYKRHISIMLFGYLSHFWRLVAHMTNCAPLKCNFNEFDMSRRTWNCTKDSPNEWTLNTEQRISRAIA